MKIQDVSIKYFYGGKAVRRKKDNLAVDNKLLPFMSICFCESGKYHFEFEDRDPIDLLPGQAVLIGSNIKHSITHIFDEKNEMRHVWFFMSYLIEDQFELDDIFEFPMLLPDHISKEIFDLFDKYSRIDQNDSSLNVIAQTNFLAFAVLKVIAPLATQITITEDENIKYCVDYINNHYLERISVQTLCAIVNYSKSSLFEKFQKYMKSTPFQYQEKLRMNHAAMLLISTNKSIREIASASGFDDPLYFSKRFKKHYNKSPQSYRKDIMN